MTRILNAIYIYLAIVALILALFLLTKSGKTGVGNMHDGNFSAVIINNHEIPVTIANDDTARQIGLSHSLNLSTGTGKLFIFDKEGKYGFWMKDMNYPIDIVWISSSMKVVAVSANITPETYPKIFYPPSAVQFVLEINANESKKFNIKEGEGVILKFDF